MAKNNVETYGALGKRDLLMFDPATLNVIVDPAHPLYDERVKLPLDEAMIANIMFQGVIEPIVVTRDRDTGEVNVVAGRQRVRNAREANLRLVDRGLPPVRIAAYASAADMAVLQAMAVSENEIRQDDTIAGRADKMLRLQQAGRSDAELATIFGVSEATVRNTLALGTCTSAVRKAVERGSISATHAVGLAKLPVAEQREKVQALIAAGDGLKGHARARAQRAVVQKPRTRGRKEIDAKLQLLDADEGKGVAERGWIAALRWVLGSE